MLGLDPFTMISENEELDNDEDYDASDKEIAHGVDFIDDLGIAEESDDDDMMLDGGMHLMASKRGNHQTTGSNGNLFVAPMQDCVTKVADECIDLNQFITKMDELVYS